MVLPWTWLFLPTWWTIGWQSRCHGVLRYKLSSLLRYSTFYCLVGEVIVCWLYQSVVIYPLEFVFDCCGGYSLGYLEVFLLSPSTVLMVLCLVCFLRSSPKFIQACIFHNVIWVMLVNDVLFVYFCFIFLCRVRRIDFLAKCKLFLALSFSLHLI